MADAPQPAQAAKRALGVSTGVPTGVSTGVPTGVPTGYNYIVRLYTVLYHDTWYIP